MTTASNAQDFEQSTQKQSTQATLRRLTGSVVAKKFCTIDIETTQWVNPYAVGFFDGEEYQDFIGDDCIERALLAVLTPAYAGNWIYAHNGGGFDFLFFIRTFLTSPTFRGKYLIEITPIGSTLLRIQVAERDKDFRNEKKRNAKGQLKWTFVDSLRLLPLSLNEVGKTFGIGKKVDLNVSYDDLALPQHREMMREYLETDCRLLWRSIDLMQDTINNLGGELGITLPATALDLFRRSFQRKDIAVNRHYLACKQHNVDHKRNAKPAADACKGCMHEFIRRAYYGGRTEIFRMEFEPSHGHEEMSVYDINSHYPHCMLEPMPIGQAIELENITESQVYAFAKNLIGIVDCEVYIPPDCYLPPLPHVINGKLMFPVGHFRGTWDTAELTLLAEVGGTIIKTYKSAWFETGELFNGFIETLYRFRDKTRAGWTKGMDFIAKILMNSAYGKFAMREERQKVVINPGTIEGMSCLDLEADVWTEDVYVAPTYIVPQISTHITALARARLWRLLNAVVLTGGRIYYADTDSLFISGCELPTSTGLGGLKLESIVTRARFVLPKLYLIETKEAQTRKTKEANIKVKAKGMGPGIKTGQDGKADPFDGQLSELEFQNLTKFGITLNRNRLSKFKEGLREYAKDATSFPRIKASPKAVRTAYDKRMVLEDFDTSPFVLGA